LTNNDRSQKVSGNGANPRAESLLVLDHADGIHALVLQNGVEVITALSLSGPTTS
jgi:hypothetical protein